MVVERCNGKAPNLAGKHNCVDGKKLKYVGNNLEHEGCLAYWRRVGTCLYGMYLVMRLFIQKSDVWKIGKNEVTPGDARLGDAVCDALDADYFVRRERERNKKGFHSTSSSNGHFFLCLFLVSRRRFLFGVWGLFIALALLTTHTLVTLLHQRFSF